MNCRVLGEGNKGKFMPKGKYISIRALYKSISKDFALNITTEVMVKFCQEVNWKGFMYFEGLDFQIRKFLKVFDFPSAFVTVVKYFEKRFLRSVSSKYVFSGIGN